MRMRKRARRGWVRGVTWRIAAAVPALVLAAVLAGCGLFPKERPVVQPVLPEPPSTSSSVTYPVTRGEIAEMIVGTAEVTPVRKVALYFREAGRIREISVEPGQRVVAGRELVRLDIGDLDHQLRVARIDQQIAEISLERMTVMDANIYDRRIQELVVARCRATVDYLQGRIDASTIRAPFAGAIESVEAVVSDRVQEYATVVVLSDPAVLELQMRVSRDQSTGIYEGITIEVSGDDEHWLPSRVIQITHRDPLRDATVRAEEFVVHLTLPRQLRGVNLGSLLRSRIVLRRKTDALLIPLAGLREFGGRTYVRVLEGDVRREQDVRVGIRTETEAEILAGLDEGQLVISR
jgi:RND family efflux transporter MFP subunit